MSMIKPWCGNMMDSHQHPAQPLTDDQECDGRPSMSLCECPGAGMDDCQRTGRAAIGMWPWEVLSAASTRRFPVWLPGWFGEQDHVCNWKQLHG